MMTLFGAVKKIQEVIDNQVESADYTVFNFIVDDDVSATKWLEQPLLQECKSVMLSNVVYLDEHGIDADRPFRVALSKTIDKLKVSFKNLNLVEKNI